ncbi:unnamed protein product [Mytilus coruscus]|uniref:Uncharacterized protein n=1 Tax=Mytilus coruscus TaxID=42192 RepID=A0A6J8CQS9_MYTCO|nr:unnamed protein product [Mytilus coruscus]
MEMYEAKIKTWEDFIPTNLDKFDNAKKQTETFLESMRNILQQEQQRLNDSFQETVENIYLKSESKIKSVLESKIGELETKSESALELLQSSQMQDQEQFNVSFHKIVENMYIQSGNKVKSVIDSVSSKMEEFSESHKKGENALQLLQSSLMQDQERFNESIHEIVANMHIQSGNKVKSVLDSVSSKMEEFSESHKKG